MTRKKVGGEFKILIESTSQYTFATFISAEKVFLCDDLMKTIPNSKYFEGKVLQFEKGCNQVLIR